MFQNFFVLSSKYTVPDPFGQDDVEQDSHMLRHLEADSSGSYKICPANRSKKDAHGRAKETGRRERC